MKIIELLVKNIIVLYFGAFIRYLLNCVLRRSPKKSFHYILHGIEEKSKEDEIYNYNNEFVNRVYGFAGLLVIVMIIVFATR